MQRLLRKGKFALHYLNQKKVNHEKIPIYYRFLLLAVLLAASLFYVLAQTGGLNPDQKDVAAFFNENFINVSLDVEKGRGPELASKWKIHSLPTLIVFDAAGQPVLQSIGYVKPEDLLAFGKQAL
ncbi:MAG TPA: thioredoxin fold domain-containing protein, partial [Puia sp.]